MITQYSANDFVCSFDKNVFRRFLTSLYFCPYPSKECTLCLVNICLREFYYIVDENIGQNDRPRASLPNLVIKSQLEINWMTIAYQQIDYISWMFVHLSVVLLLQYPVVHAYKSVKTNRQCGKQFKKTLRMKYLVGKFHSYVYVKKSFA